MKPYELIAATDRSGLTPTERLLLFRVAMWSNGTEGSCWVSVATMVDATGLGERTVQETLKSLVGLGVLVPELKPGRTTQYRVDPSRIPPPQRLHPRKRRTPQASHPTPATLAPGGATAAPAPATLAPDLEVQGNLKGTEGKGLPPADQPTEIDATPPWAKGWRGNTSAAVTEAVLRALSAIRQETVTTRCNGDARLFRSLWQADGFPPVGELASDVEDVSRWARESAEAEDELRGLNARGVQWRPDRSTSARTLLDPKAFGDYRAYARRWKVAGDPPPASARGSPVNGRRMGHAGDGVLEAMWRERNPPSEVYDGDG